MTHKSLHKWLALPFHSLLYLACFSLVISAIPSDALAAGIFLPGNGTRSAGKAGAVIATGDDADAVYHNPANLSRLGGFGIRLDAIFSIQKVTFTRASEMDTVKKKMVDFKEVAKPTDPAFIPQAQIFFNIPKLGPGTLTLALFFYGPHGRFGFKYKEDAGDCKLVKDPKQPPSDAKVCKKMAEPGSQRLNLIRTSSPMVYFGLSSGYGLKIADEFTLRFGASFKVVSLSVFQRQAAIAASNLYKSYSEKITNGEVIMELDAKGYYLTGNIGVSADLPKGFRVGASFLLPAKADLNGNLNVEVSSFFGSLAQIKGTDMNLVTYFPPILRAGVGWQGHGFSVEAAYVGEMWSYLESYDITPKGIQLVFGGKATDLPAFKVPQGLVDSHSVRLGVEYNIKKIVLVRAGYIFETGSTKEERLSVGNIDFPNKQIVTVGASFRLPWADLSLDLGFIQIFTQEFNIKNSKVDPIDVTPEDNPLLKSDKPIKATSNGKYSFGVTAFSIGVQGSFDFLGKS